MDTQPPYASGVSRLRLIYRFAAPHDAARVLVIGPSQAARDAFDLDARPVDVVEPGRSPAGAAHDLVALPGTLDRDRAAPLFGAAHAALRPGGRVAGHLSNAGSLHGWRETLRGRSRAGATAARLQRELAAAGFVDAECFYVEPRIESPMALVPVQWRAAREHFLRAIRRTRRHYRPAGYGMRLALAAVGLGGMLQPQLFFWARRPC